MVSLTCQTVKTQKTQIALNFQCRLFPCCWSSLQSRLPFQQTRPRRSSRVPFGTTRVFVAVLAKSFDCNTPLSSETQEFCTAIPDTFNNGTQAEAVNRFLASRNSCRTGHATQRMFVVCTVHLFQMELHPTRTDCPLAFGSFCSSVVVMLERSSGTSGTRAFFETETRNSLVFFRSFELGVEGLAWLSSARLLWARDQCVLLPIILEGPPTIATSLF